VHANKLLLLLTAAALTAAAAALPVSIAAAGTAAPASPLISHIIDGCGVKPVIVWSPRTPGAPLDAPALGWPDGPGSLIAKANALHVTWLRTITCGHSDLSAGSSNAWSGYGDAPSQGVAYAQAEYYNPPAGAPQTPSSIDWAFTWDGIGGLDGSGEIVQDGTEQVGRCIVSHGKCARQDPYYEYWSAPRR
jgi:hypothetical protein